MDAWDSDFREPTADEVSARRILSLAIALINARRPLTTTEIRREFYPMDMSDAAFAKTFARDRKQLLATGLVVCGNKKGANKQDVATWFVDADASFANESVLTAQDALLLDFLLLPLASDPSYPYARDLRLALAKIDRAFDGSSKAVIPPEARMRNNNISRMEECRAAGHAASITYKRADGSTVERVVAPYGFFCLLNNTYMVAANLDEPEDGPHTYRFDRVLSSKELPRRSFVIPDDFDVRDFIVLPFQIGEPLYYATFEDSKGTHRVEYVCDESMAASWAIAKGMRPVDPESLVLEWKRMLERAAGGKHGKA